MFLYNIVKEQLYQSALIIFQNLLELTWHIWRKRLYIDFWGNSPFLPFCGADGEFPIWVSHNVQCGVSDQQHLNNFPNEIFKCFWYYSQSSNHSNKIDDKIWNVFTRCLCEILISLWVNNIHQLAFTCFPATSNLHLQWSKVQLTVGILKPFQSQ